MFYYIIRTCDTGEIFGNLRKFKKANEKISEINMIKDFYLDLLKLCKPRFKIAATRKMIERATEAIKKVRNYETQSV